MNILSDQNIKKLFNLFKSDDLDSKIKLSVVESLHNISTLMNFRKIFLRASNYESLIKYSIKIRETLEET